jgi:hypothetical protein
MIIVGQLSKLKNTVSALRNYEMTALAARKHRFKILLLEQEQEQELLVFLLLLLDANCLNRLTESYQRSTTFVFTHDRRMLCDYYSLLTDKEAKSQAY